MRVSLQQVIEHDTAGANESGCRLYLDFTHPHACGGRKKPVEDGGAGCAFWLPKLLHLPASWQGAGARCPVFVPVSSTSRGNSPVRKGKVRRLSRLVEIRRFGVLLPGALTSCWPAASRPSSGGQGGW